MAAVAMAIVAAACSAPGGGGGPAGTTRYVDQVFASVTADTGLVYATAPDLSTSAPVDLAADLFRPAGDTADLRPAIVWIHGGGFKAGSRSSTTDVAQSYARRGYVTASIDYRLDPGNRCQDVQDGVITDPVEAAAERDRCTVAIIAAQHDAQAAVRWLRANASAFGIDPGRIAVGGFSAGAVTAVNVAQRSEDPGTVGSHLDQSSTVGAGLSASGCNYDPGSIDGADAPVFLLASGLDRSVDFSCVAATEQATRAVGAGVQTMYFPSEGTHALALYTKYRPQVDAAWTSFLVANLGL
jgi:dienelactone hydrolase